jgi:hypothetical protein
VFGTISFAETCAIGEEVDLKGSVVGLVDNGNEAVEHLITFSEAIQKLFQVSGQGDKLLFGNAEAFVTGSGIAVLDLEHIGKNWGVI